MLVIFVFDVVAIFCCVPPKYQFSQPSNPAKIVPVCCCDINIVLLCAEHLESPAET